MQCINIENASLNSISKTFNIHNNTLKLNIQKGMSKAQAVIKYRHDCSIDNIGNLIIPDTYDISNLNIGITAFGKHYKSKEELAKQNNISINTLNYRLKLGYSLDEAIVFDSIKKVKKLRHETGLHINEPIDIYKLDDEIKLLNEAINKLKLNKIHNKELDKQSKIDEINSLKRREQWEKENGEVPLEKAKYIVFDKRFSSMKYLCNYYGISEDSVYSTMNRKGISLEDTIDQLLGKYVIDGKRYKSLANVAKEYNIGRTTLLNRLERGMTLKQAVSVDKQREYKPISVEYKGEKFRSISEACIRLNIKCRNSINKYINNGYTFEQAVDLYNNNVYTKKCIKQKKLQDKLERNQRILDKRICINGTWYENVKDACRKLGISDNTVRKYVRDEKITHEEAILKILDKIKNGDNRIGSQRKTRSNEAEIARQYGLNASRIASYRYKYKDYETPAEIIADRIVNNENKREQPIYIVNNDIKSIYKNLKTFCKEFNLDYIKINNYKLYHNISVEQSIIHYKPEYYINMHGELVIT